MPIAISSIYSLHKQENLKQESALALASLAFVLIHILYRQFLLNRSCVSQQHRVGKNIFLYIVVL